MILNNINKKFPLKHSVRLPASKSVCNRLLVLQYLQGSSFEIEGVSEADDSQLLQSILATNELSGELNVKNAGTCFRFLTAVCAIGNSEVILTGSREMKKRPIKELVEPLRSLGAEIQYLEKKGFPPIKINGKQLNGGKVEVNAEISSQYVSALLLIAPFLEKGLVVEQTGEPKSKSYTNMTISLLKRMGVSVKEESKTISVLPIIHFFTNRIEIEADWSSASYWYELISFLPVNSKIQLQRVKTFSIQGDREIQNMFKSFGVSTLEGRTGIEIVKTSEPKITTFEYDFSSIPDMVQTFAVTCIGLGINGVFQGVSHLVYKETNRIQALKNEAEKLNYSLEMLDENSFELKKKGAIPSQVSISTYHDHRMAMAFAPLAAVIEQVEIENPQVVAKSYPGFWDEFC